MALEGKVAIVTGASAGIGEQIAKLFAKEKAKVVLAARREDRLNALKAEIESSGGVALVVKTDVTDRQQCKDLVRIAEEKLGPVNILINNSGIMPLTFVKNLHEDEWEKTIDVNIKGVLNCIAAVLPGMLARNSGDIVNISSDAGRKVFPGAAIYCGTKWAVEAITQGLRLETANTNLKITSIQPGATKSELIQSVTDTEVLDFLGKPPFELLDSEDVARATLFAVSQPPNCAINEIMLRPTGQRS
eukprot:TRINITY_DN2202_c0_g1_i1.p1 TRINITY_DN2202_c0_g1~~TRINITY_DN2202_c0_g1_i1.p1  ORF type:complete len:275 (+),score=89.74 TRINITY_DN2202_c0_g1_i1:89-826(+)